MKNKTLILLFTMISILSYSVRAQDIIIKKDGTRVEAKVSEILDSEVKYKKHENLNGPIYSMQKSDIISIDYENGTKDVFSEEESKSIETKPSENQALSKDLGDSENVIQSSRKYLYTKDFKFIIGGSFFFGGGPEKHDLFMTADGENVTLSPGGGFGFDLVFGYLVSEKIELDLNTGFQMSSLSKTLENADADFLRFFISSDVKYLIPTKNNNGAWKIGGGIGYYIPTSLNVEWNDMSNISDGNLEIEYDGSLGFHIVGEYEMFLPQKNWALGLYFKYYYTQYEYSSAQVINIVILDVGDFEKLNGSSFNFGMSMKKYF